ncbi:MAG: hypothetical protein IJO56_04470 [Oscillospiraceae bacterium]|nr:hypothetical protein [Oscillospiraceae bacterium]
MKRVLSLFLCLMLLLCGCSTGTTGEATTTAPTICLTLVKVGTTNWNEAIPNNTTNTAAP